MGLVVVGNEKRLDLTVVRDLVKVRLRNAVSVDATRISPAIDRQFQCTAASPTASAPPHPRTFLGRARDGSRCGPARRAIATAVLAASFSVMLDLSLCDLILSIFCPLRAVKSLVFNPQKYCPVSGKCPENSCANFLPNIKLRLLGPSPDRPYRPTCMAPPFPLHAPSNPAKY